MFMNSIKKVYTYSLFAFAAVFFGFAIISILFNISQDKFSTIKVIIFALLIILLYSLLKYLVNKSDFLHKIVHFKHFNLFVFLALFVWQLFIVISTSKVEVMNDPLFLRVFSSKTNLTEQIDWSASDYLNAFPNNAVYTLVYHLIGQIALFFNADFWLIGGIINILIIDFTLIILYYLSKDFVESNIPNILFIFLFATTGYVRVLYSDTPAMLFVLMAVYVLNKIVKNIKINNRVYLFQIIVFALIISLGYIAKPTAIILLIALFITIIFNTKFKDLSSFFISTNTFLNKASLLLAIILITLITNFSYPILMNATIGKINNISSENIENWEKRAVGPEHYILMSMQKESPNTQYYYQPILSKSLSYGINKDLRIKNTKDDIIKTIQSYTPSEFAKFLIAKAAFNISDGTFTYYYYSTSEQERILNIKQNVNKLANLFVNTETYFWHGFYKDLLEAIWLLTLIGCLIFSIRQILIMKVSKCLPSLINSLIILSILGLQLFLLIFEAKPRYEIIMIPLFVLISAKGWEVVKKLNIYSHFQNVNKSFSN